MDYFNHYQKLILKAKQRKLDPNTYFEKHHIIPRCMNGSDDLSNIINLLPQEHLIAHLLLYKMYPQNPKIVFAAICFINGLNGSKKNKQYKKLKERKSQIMSEYFTGRPKTAEHRKKLSDAAKRRYSKYGQDIFGGSKKGITLTEEHKLNIGKSIKGKKHSDETKLKISIAQKGVQKSEETKKRMSESAKRRWVNS